MKLRSFFLGAIAVISATIIWGKAPSVRKCDKWHFGVRSTHFTLIDGQEVGYVTLVKIPFVSCGVLHSLYWALGIKEDFRYLMRWTRREQ